MRLRLLNASTARTYTFGFEDLEMDLIATDGGLVDAPVQTDQLRLAPGERAEVIVSMAPGTTARLKSFETELGGVAAPFAMGENLRRAHEIVASGSAVGKVVVHD